jgi:hypothetical protein
MQSGIKSTKCCISSVVSPDDGHIVARNICKLINILRLNFAPSCWRYLQDYTVTHIQQSIKFYTLSSFVYTLSTKWHIKKTIKLSANAFITEEGYKYIGAYKLTDH